MSSTTTPVTLSDAAGGTFTPAYTVGNLVFTSGQVGLDPITGDVPESFDSEVRRVIANLKRVLAEAGTDLSGVVKTTCFLTDMAYLGAFNEIYEEHFPEPRPARSALQAGLARNFRVEIEAVAVIR